MSSESAVTQISLPLPRSLDTRIHVHLTTKAKAVTLFLTSVTQDEQSGPAALGSFVYALPNDQRLEPAQPISTAIYSVESTLEFTTRMAKLLAKRTGMPVYVGCSINPGGSAMGLSVEEEMEAFRAIVDVVTGKLKGGQAAINGVS
ncbi:hypothetical protein LY78DRAFT_718304 [Colletotrichum sublineola]|nr:hypothetical protein LY78DRAFT_718304 [Colletotrichum sublineola]